MRTSMRYIESGHVRRWVIWMVNAYLGVEGKTKIPIFIFLEVSYTFSYMELVKEISS